MFDPWIGRTPTMDPLTETSNDHSPYSWVKNNPLLRIDPSLKGFNTITSFHTHLSNLAGVSRSDVERPSGTTGSGGDLDFRDKYRSQFYNLLILTRTAIYPSQVQKIPYTNWK